MDKVLKLFAQAQVLLAQIIFRRNQKPAQILQVSDIRDESVPIEYLHILLDQAGLSNSYSIALQSQWGNRPGVGMVSATLEERCEAVFHVIAFMPPQKHVIFLGAGASASAGYPLGNRLAELMKNPTSLQAEFLKCLIASGMTEEAAKKISSEFLNPFLERFAEPLRLFKGSRYPTIDHFSKESRNGKFHEAVQELKRLVRLILALPGGRKFDSSDYNQFIEKLFESSGRLRTDVTLITFNYDFCLQYHLFERLYYRNQIKQVCDAGELHSLHNGLTSGIGGWPERSWSTKKQMAILQLHGSIAYPSQHLVGENIVFGELLYEKFFLPDLSATLGKLTSPELEAAPLAFPFELFDEDGNFIQGNTFPLDRRNQFGSSDNLQELFAFLWNHARQEVQSADRVSFVGLSLHPFLEPGLRFLFKGKSGPTQLVIANPENQSLPINDPCSLASRTIHLLNHASQGKIECLLSASDRSQPEDIAKRKGATAYPTFAEMIAHEL